MKRDKLGGACDIDKRDEKCIQKFNGRSRPR
jgi:hypothetical protein